MFLCPPLNVTISFAVPSPVSLPIPSSLSTAVPFSILHSASRYCRLLHIVLQEAYLMALLEGGGGCFPGKVGRRLPTSIEWEHQCAPTSTPGKYMTYDTDDRSFTIFSPRFLGGLLLCKLKIYVLGYRLSLLLHHEKYFGFPFLCCSLYCSPVCFIYLYAVFYSLIAYSLYFYSLRGYFVNDAFSAPHPPGANSTPCLQCSELCEYLYCRPPFSTTLPRVPRQKPFLFGHWGFLPGILKRELVKFSLTPSPCRHLSESTMDASTRDI